MSFPSCDLLENAEVVYERECVSVGVVLNGCWRGCLGWIA